MSAVAALGWDVGGAHLKRAAFAADGRLLRTDIAPCALWRGLDELRAAFDALGTPDVPSAATMTGELVDLWPDRATGVAALAAALADRLGPDLALYAGPDGFVAPSAAGRHAARIASANWHATAAALARAVPEGILIDIGSTTTDIVPLAGGQVAARGFSDAERLDAGELVYSGIARTPVMALARCLPFDGRMVPLMAEHFATTADIHRLTGDLPDGADLHPAADGGAKTSAASARRLLRMVGRDLAAADTNAAALRPARALAFAAAAEQMHMLARALAQIISAGAVGPEAAILGAGVGAGLATRLAVRAERRYLDAGALLSEDAALSAGAAACAPAVAVGRLAHAAGLFSRPEPRLDAIP
ncbi:hydantoinase/oxoprolinase family protein [Aquabacter spiritensis]|uniref:Putative H4MPT-linked C1 transfer pathway protein n=1 Tax=Aquabacter spiritensis TaxID=933073 RepID=A0A4R3LY39_9HYPH|nr:hydantoinase/oxoprolinase family protein [Aquabacter spiritensis]TCT04719.1 putative H4MPT-linked C1 transfer pathway protein [Aquabacter spiritensis]